MMDYEKKYPADSNKYKLYEEVGEGVSATVFRALCVPANETVAIKVLDLERCNSDLDGIRREVQTMNLIDHPNVLRAYCSFIVGYSLWVVMPYMTGGSCLHIMKTAYPEGFEEPVIATLLKETLKALVYLHSEGHIHRDVKAGNILIDTNGSVKLADFGVSACMFDTGDRQRSRITFVGTPCWMAPEVMQQLHGYDFKADIWSFGITALELAHGHAPFSKYPPMKVLLMTLQNAPPGLDYERDKRFSKSFKELVAACLVKDPKKRPTAEKLLKHHFFKNARSTDYISRTVLEGLHPLGERYKTMKAKEADLLMQNKLHNDEKEERSQKEYIKGISAWNFNLGDLKSQAALIQDDFEIPKVECNENTINPPVRENDEDSIPNETLPPSRDVLAVHEDNINDLQEAGNSLKPLQELNECFDVVNEDLPESRPQPKNLLPKSSSYSKDLDAEKLEMDNVSQVNALCRKKSLPDRKPVEDSKETISQKVPSERNYSGPLISRIKREIGVSTGQDDASEGVVKLKGRFKVTSADSGHKGPSLPKASIISSLQTILQQNTTQRDEITKLLKYLEQSNAKQTEIGEVAVNDSLPIQGSLTAKEIGLQNLAITHEQSIRNLTDDLQRMKMKNAELEELLNVKRQGEL